MSQRRASVRPQLPLRNPLAIACAGLMLLAAARVQAQPPEPEAAARKAYAAGVAAFQSGDNAAAYDHLAIADRTFSSPNIKLMLGRTLARLGKRSEAYHVFNDALTAAGDAPRYETTARALRDELRELEKQLAIVRILVDDPGKTAQLRIDDHTIERELWAEPLALEPGSVHVELTDATGRRDAHQLELSAGSSLALAMRIPERVPSAEAAPLPAPQAATTAETAVPADAPSSHQLRPVSYVVAGFGIAGLAAFGVLGAMSQDQFSKLESACPNPKQCDARYRDNATRGQTYQTAANISLGVGAAALATGIVLWLVSFPKEMPVQSSLAITPHSVQWTGSF
jgi:tetratricopeptide (TPR) repeat protein